MTAAAMPKTKTAAPDRYRDGTERVTAPDLAALVPADATLEERAAILRDEAAAVMRRAEAMLPACSPDPLLGLDPLIPADMATVAARLVDEWAKTLTAIASR